MQVYSLLLFIKGQSSHSYVDTFLTLLSAAVPFLLGLVFLVYFPLNLNTTFLEVSIDSPELDLQLCHFVHRSIQELSAQTPFVGEGPLLPLFVFSFFL